MPCPQASYYILTIPYENFTPFLPPNVKYIKGQLEQGANTGYLHWQLIIHFNQKKRFNTRS